MTTDGGVSRPARLAPGTRSQVGVLTWVFVRLAGLVTRSSPPRLFLILGRHRPLFRGWLLFAAKLMPRGKLPRRETELVILLVARLCGCDYEYRHHLGLARRAGVTAEEIGRLGEPGAPGWSPREAAVLRAAEVLHREREFDEQTWQELRGHLRETEIIELIMLVGHYEMLALFIGSLEIRPDEPRGRSRDR